MKLLLGTGDVGDWGKVLNLITPSNLAQLGRFDSNYSTLADCLGPDTMNQYQVRKWLC